MPRPEYANRFISVYFSTAKEKQHWEQVAHDCGTTLSKLVFAGLERLRQEPTTSPDIMRELEDLKTQLAKVERDARIKESIIEKQEAEIYRARYAAFAEVSPSGGGRRQFDLELIRALKDARGALSSDKLLLALRIDLQDLEAVRLVKTQLDLLGRYGFVTENSRGWSWKK